jgi:hypothetical protein
MFFANPCISFPLLGTGLDDGLLDGFLRAHADCVIKSNPRRYFFRSFWCHLIFLHWIPKTILCAHL